LIAALWPGGYFRDEESTRRFAAAGLLLGLGMAIKYYVVVGAAGIQVTA
jgi:hypothetical protein